MARLDDELDMDKVRGIELQSNVLLDEFEMDPTLMPKGTTIDIDLPVLKKMTKTMIEKIKQVSSLEDKAQEEEKSVNDEMLDNKKTLDIHILSCQNIKKQTVLLEKDGDKSLSILDKAQRLHTIIEYELYRINDLNSSIFKQFNDIVSVNTDLVEPELEKLKFDLNIAIEEETSFSNELSNGEKVLKETKALLEQVKESEHNSNILLEEKEIVERDERLNIEGLEKEIKALETTRQSVHSELQKSEDDVLKLKEEIMNIQQKKKEVQNSQVNILKIQDRHKEIHEEKKNEIRILEEKINDAKANHHSIVTSRLKVEMELREIKEKERHGRTSEMLKKKELDQMKRMYIKKRLVVDKIKDLLPQMRMRYDDIFVELQINKNALSTSIKEIDASKETLDFLLTRYTEQQNLEENMREKLNNLVSCVEEKEHELEHCYAEEKKIRKLVSIMSSQQETHIRNIKNISQAEFEVLKMIKMKKLTEMDVIKDWEEANKRIDEFSAIQSALKHEKSELTETIASLSKVLTNMRSNMPKAQHELDRLQIEYFEKGIILEKEKDALESCRGSKAALRGEAKDIRSVHRKKVLEMESLVVQIDKLRSNLSGQQKELDRIECQNNRFGNVKKIMSDQLSDKKHEIHRLLQQENAYEQVLRRGEISLQQRNQDIRALKLKCADIQRHITATKVSFQESNKYIEKLNHLEEELQSQKAVKEKFSLMIEDPMRNNCWNELSGDDPSMEELEKKLGILGERLNAAREKKIEKELSLEELSSQTKDLRIEVKICCTDTQPLVKKLNDLQSRVRRKMRSLMALVSEISMYQSTALKLKEVKQYKEQILQHSKELLEKGQPPSNDALRELKKLQQKYQLHHNNCFEPYYSIAAPTKIGISSNNTDLQFKADPISGMVFYPAKHALRSTAEPRPSAYIPNTGLEIPKPYGIKPFKPTESGAIMRHIVKPTVKKIEAVQNAN